MDHFCNASLAILTVAATFISTPARAQQSVSIPYSSLGTIEDLDGDGVFDGMFSTSSCVVRNFPNSIVVFENRCAVEFDVSAFAGGATVIDATLEVRVRAYTSSSLDLDVVTFADDGIVSVVDADFPAVLAGSMTPSGLGLGTFQIPLDVAAIQSALHGTGDLALRFEALQHMNTTLEDLVLHLTVETPDLTVTTGLPVASWGGLEQVGFRVCNASDVTLLQDPTISFYRSPDVDVTTQDALVYSFVVPAAELTPRRCQFYQREVFFTPTPIADRYAAIIDPANQITESSETNNRSGVGSRGVGSGPELAVKNVVVLSAPPQLVVGADICNYGDAPASNFFVTVGRQDASTGQRVIIASSLQGNIPPGLCFPWRSELIVTTAFPTNQILYVDADVYGVVPETNERNNRALGPGIAAGVSADLRIEKLEATRVSANGGFRVDALVCNPQGVTSPVTALAVYLSADETLDTSAGSSDVLVATVPIPVGGPRCSTVTARGTITPVPQGPAFLAVAVDPAPLVPDEDRRNNVRFHRIVFGSGFDLVVRDAVGPPILFAGGAGQSVAVTVCNDGTTTAPAATGSLFANLIAFVDQRDQAPPPSVAFGIPALGIDACATIDVPLPAVSNALLSYSAYVEIVIDSDRALVGEVDIQNNAMRGPEVLVAAAAPDFAVTDVRAPPTILVPHVAGVIYEATVCNQGTASGARPRVDFTLDDEFHVLDPTYQIRPISQALGTVMPGAPLAPGECADVATAAPATPNFPFFNVFVAAALSPADLNRRNDILWVGPIPIDTLAAPIWRFANATLPLHGPAPHTLSVDVCNDGGTSPSAALVTVRGSTHPNLDDHYSSYAPILGSALLAAPHLAGTCVPVVVPITAWSGYFYAEVVSGALPITRLPLGEAWLNATADLYVPQFLASAVAADQFDATARVCNGGDTATPATQVVAFVSPDPIVESPDVDPSSLDVPLGSAAVPSLAPFSCVDVAMTALPRAGLTGSWYVAADVSPGRLFVEGAYDNNTSPSAAVTFTTAPICGDGYVTGTEACDDGNLANGDGCNASCVPEICGDGIVNNAGSEACDDGNTTSGDGCSAACVTEFCGDGIINNGGAEQCDDGNLVNGDGCTTSCVQEICGDGIVNGGGTEICDDGNLVGGDGCSALCRIEPPPIVLGEVLFDRALQQRLLTPVPAGHPLDAAAFTVALWARAPENSGEPVASRWAPGGQVWWLGRTPQGRLTVDIAQSLSGAGGVGREFATPITGGEWMHVVVTYDAGTVHLYRDGQADDGTINGTVPTALTGGDAPLVLGEDVYSGAVGNVVFVDRALSSAEVDDLYCVLAVDQAGCTCGTDDHACNDQDLFGLPGLVAYWQLDSGPAEVVNAFDLIETNPPFVYQPRPLGPSGRVDHTSQVGFNMWAPPYDYSFVAIVDDDPATFWSVSTAQTPWLNMDFAFTTPSAHRLDEYTITNGVNGASYDPQGWSFFGSPDGVTWDILDEQTNVSFGGSNVTLTFPVSNTTTNYAYFHLSFGAVAGSVLEIAEIEFVEYTGPACGDGVVDVGEQCDDGNTLVNDGCNACTNSAINACVQPDGSTPIADPSPGSAGTCAVRACDATLGWQTLPGNAGFVCRPAVGPCDLVEQCDGIVGSCPADVVVGAGTSCADGDVCNGNEICDGNGACLPGAALDCNDQNMCTMDSCHVVNGCTNVVVDTDGDGVPNCTDNCVNAGNPGQEDVDGDGLGDACDPPVCGNGFVEAGEQCDDAAANGTPGSCDASCAGIAPSICGDGFVDGSIGEQCDDGNTSSNDGCSSTCQSEPTVCGDGYLNTASGEVCDDGNTVTEACPYGPSSCLVCDAGCQNAPGATSYCGDAAVDSANGEGCDDGNTVTESCAYGVTSCVVCGAACQSVGGLTSYCGDGNLDAANGEGCDDGNLVGGDGCSSTCAAEAPTTIDRTAEPGFSMWAPPYDYSFNAMIDDDPTTMWTVDATSPPWLNINFLGSTPTAFAVDEYTITNGPTSANDPAEWYFAASTDGINYVLLDHQVGVVFPGPNTTLTFPNPGATAYGFYHFTFIGNGSAQIQIAELEFNEYTGATP